MRMSQSATSVLKEADDRISYVLAHPGMSPWLKQALRTALECDPTTVLNDLEILNTILHPRSETLISLQLTDLPQATSFRTDRER